MKMVLKIRQKPYPREEFLNLKTQSVEGRSNWEPKKQIRIPRRRLHLECLQNLAYCRKECV